PTYRFIKQFEHLFIFGPGLSALSTASWRNRAAHQKKSCEAGSKVLFPLLPNFARACGRVSVGRYPDKRPDSRQRDEGPRVAPSLRLGSETKPRDAKVSRRTSKTSSGQHLSPGMPLKEPSLVATVTGSRRRTGAPRSQRGTRLKATTDRAFLVSTGSPTPARATEKACPSLPGERAGKFPTNPRQHNSV